MASRLVIATLLWVACFPLQFARAQQVTSDNQISGAALSDNFTFLGACDAQGQLYRRGQGRLRSIMRVSRDGSTMVFALPINAGEALLGPFAPVLPGLAVIALAGTKDGPAYEMYLFDGEGHVVTHRRVAIDFNPTAMAVMPSGTTAIVGYRATKDGRAYVGALLDSRGNVSQTFAFPTVSATETEWNFAQIAAGEGTVYFVPNSASGPLYIITESGKLQIIPLFPSSGVRHHKWMLASGVAVEEYEMADEKVPRSIRFDVYDVSTGKKIATKTVAHPVGFTTGCFLGDEVSFFAHGGPGSNTLRLRTAKLE